MPRRSLFIVTLLVGSCGLLAAAPPDPPQAPGQLPAPCFGLLVASVHEGTVYTISHGGIDRDISPRVWHMPLRPGDRPAREERSSICRGWVYGYTLDQFHWHLAHDQIWAECAFLSGSGSCHRIPMEDLPLLDASKDADRSEAALSKKYGDYRAVDASYFMAPLAQASRELIEPIEEAARPRQGGAVGVGVMEFDFLPTGPKTWDFFLVYKSRMTIWKCAEKPKRDPEFNLRVAEYEKCGDGIETGFHEPFFVYGKPESPFFITKSGKVFQCLRRGKKEARFVKVWDDDKRPVTTILNDADANRTFVAGRDLPEGPDKWFYFELADKVEKKPFDRAAVQAEAEEPLKSALLFARFLAKEGKVKDKSK